MLVLIRSISKKVGAHSRKRKQEDRKTTGQWSRCRESNVGTETASAALRKPEPPTGFVLSAPSLKPGSKFQVLRSQTKEAPMHVQTCSSPPQTTHASAFTHDVTADAFDRCLSLPVYEKDTSLILKISSTVASFGAKNKENTCWSDDP